MSCLWFKWMIKRLWTLFFVMKGLQSCGLCGSINLVGKVYIVRMVVALATPLLLSLLLAGWVPSQFNSQVKISGRTTFRYPPCLPSWHAPSAAGSTRIPSKITWTGRRSCTKPIDTCELVPARAAVTHCRKLICTRTQSPCLCLATIGLCSRSL